MLHPFHQYPVHLYHAEKPAVVAHTAVEEANARADGYSETYVHQEYPKHVIRAADGVTVTVANAEQEADATRRPARVPKKTEA